MTTKPPFQIASQAQSGFSNASAYDKHRPTYPAAAVEKLLSNLHVAGEKGARIIDVGAGTGKFTESLARREEGFEILAVEPHTDLRKILVEKKLDNVTVLDANAESMPIEDGWGDACVAAQAFHWFATEEALREIHRVLTPGAAFGMIWNMENYNGPREWPICCEWERELNEIMYTHEDGHDRFRHLKWKNVFEDQVDSTPLQTLRDTFTHRLPTFSLPLGEDKVPWTVYLTDEALWERYSTISHIANLDPEEKEKVRKKIELALKKESTQRNEKGEVAVHGQTYFAWTSRI